MVTWQRAANKNVSFFRTSDILKLRVNPIIIIINIPASSNKTCKGVD